MKLGKSFNSLLKVKLTVMSGLYTLIDIQF